MNIKQTIQSAKEAGRVKGSLEFAKAMLGKTRYDLLVFKEVKK